MKRGRSTIQRSARDGRIPIWARQLFERNSHRDSQQLQHVIQALQWVSDSLRDVRACRQREEAEQGDGDEFDDNQGPSAENDGDTAGLL